MSIETLIARYTDAWNSGDADLYAALFGEDAVFVDVLGRIQRGRPTIATEHGKLFATIYRGSTLAMWDVDATDVGPKLVLAHTASRLHVPGGPRAGDVDAVQTMLVHEDLVIAFHNTLRSDLADFAGEDGSLAATKPLNWRR